jgi:hypothetical protein
LTWRGALAILPAHIQPLANGTRRSKMVARVAIFEGVNIEAAKATMDEAEAIIRPILEGLPGYQGVTELVSEDGHFISITYFDTAENAAAAEPTFDQEMPAKLGHIFSEWAGHRTSAGVFMVAGDDRV